MQSQMHKMLKGGGKRQEYIDLYGYDTKFAAHLIRLGIQGVEYLKTGHIQLPIDNTYLSSIRRIKTGLSSYEEISKWAMELEKELKSILKDRTYNVPKEPDSKSVNEMLEKIYTLGCKVDTYQGF